MQGETLPQVVERLAQFQEKRPFLTLVSDGAPDQTLSYGDLYRLQTDWARQFVAAGVRQGQSVVIIWPHSAALYGALGGAILMGAVPAVYAFPSSKLSAERYFATLDTLLIQCEARLIVVYPALAARIRAFLAGAGIRIPVVHGLDEKLSEKIQTFTSNARPDDVAFLQYSSGTTGLKKGVAVTHRALLWQVRAYAKAIALVPSDVIISWLPLYHDMGLVACFMLPWLTNIPLVAMSPFSWIQRPECLLDKIRDYRATLCWQPNFAYTLLANRVESLAPRTWDLSSMRMFVNCSEPITDASHARFLSALAPSGVLSEMMGGCYAMAENTFAVSNTSPGKGAAKLCVDAREFDRCHRVAIAKQGDPVRIWVSSGTPMEGVSVKIRDDHGRDLAEGEVGEVAVNSPCLFSGYQRGSGSTHDAMRDGYFLTGDFGLIWGGELFITGRKKDIIIVAGKNIYPQDIEGLVEKINGVIAGRSAAFGVEDMSSGTEKIVVVAETAIQDSRSVDNVKREIANVLYAADYVVDEIELVAPQWLLKSTSGKISRALNRERYISEFGNAGRQPVDNSVAADPVLRVLKTVLPASAHAIALSDNTRLIASGLLDSMTLTSLLMTLERELSVSLPGDFLDAFMVDDRLSVLRRLVDRADKESGKIDETKNDWNKKSFERFVAGDDRRKFELAPQLADANYLGATDDAITGRMSAANYRSPTLNTDESGFRRTMRGEETLTWESFRESKGKKGVVLGNSVAFGVGVSADAQTCASQLNNGRNGVVWYNLALRRSNIKQEFAALRKKVDCVPSHIVWLSGVNDLKFFLVDLANAIQGVNVDNFVLTDTLWWANYNKFKTRFFDVMRGVNEYRLKNDLNLIFALQPTTNWVEKKLTPEEAVLVNGYDCSFNMLLRRILTSVITPLYPDYRAFVQTTCDDLGITYLDFNQHPAIRKAEEWLFMDRLHLGDKGHAIMARAIEEILV